MTELTPLCRTDFASVQASLMHDHGTTWTQRMRAHVAFYSTVA
jgi:hypothetical protein